MPKTPKPSKEITKMPRVRQATKEEHKMLERFAAMNRESREQRKLAARPEVGAVFLYNNHLWIDSTPVDKAETHGDHKGHEGGHDTFWARLQLIGSVPPHVEYDEVPRGRVGYNVKTRTYHLFLDNCILKNKHMVDKILSVMNLPPEGTEIGLDSHYECPGCKKKSKSQLDQEEDDWDF
jgi:hypothetical protein